MKLTELEKEKVNSLLLYFKNLRLEELKKNNKLTKIEVSISIHQVTELFIYLECKDLVTCNYDEGICQSMVSFLIKICRFSGRTLNCHPENDYFLEKFL